MTPRPERREMKDPAYDRNGGLSSRIIAVHRSAGESIVAFAGSRVVQRRTRSMVSRRSYEASDDSGRPHHRWRIFRHRRRHPTIWTRGPKTRGPAAAAAGKLAAWQGRGS